MSKHILTLLISELSTVRIICRGKDCGAVIELPTARLDAAFLSLDCPYCQAPIRRSKPGEDHLAELARAYRGLLAVQDKVGIEFVIPQKD